MFRLMPQDSTNLGRQPTRSCDDCGAPTRERKPYCPEHIMQHGYPKELVGVICSVEQEIERVRRIGPRAVNLRGLVVEEIMAGIAANGTLTWRRLLKDHVTFLNNETSSTASAYLRKLARNRLIHVEVSRRGMEIVTLTEKGAEFMRSRR